MNNLEGEIKIRCKNRNKLEVSEKGYNDLQKKLRTSNRGFNEKNNRICQFVVGDIMMKRDVGDICKKWGIGKLTVKKMQKVWGK